MINDLWPILVIIIAVFFAFKFFKSIIKLVLILALILIGLIVFSICPRGHHHLILYHPKSSLRLWSSHPSRL